MRIGQRIDCASRDGAQAQAFFVLLVCRRSG
jgi:hypothetical protein